MFENARARGDSAERIERADTAFGDDDDLAGFDRAFIGRADNIKCNGFRREDGGVSELAHDQRADAERVAAGNHALGRHADERISPFDLLQRIDELVEQGAVCAGGDKVNDDFGVARRLEDRPATDELALDGHCVRNIAIVRDGKTARGEIGIERLDIAQRRFAGGGVTDVAAGDRTGQTADNFVAVEIAGDMTHRAVRMEMRAIPAGDPGRFLSAMLQGVKAERNDGRGSIGTPDAKDAAFLAEFVVVKRMCCQHDSGDLRCADAAL